MEAGNEMGKIVDLRGVEGALVEMEGRVLKVEDRMVVEEWELVDLRGEKVEMVEGLEILVTMHYGFSYHFSENGTFFSQINIVTSIFIENC